VIGLNKRVCHITTVHPTFDLRIFHKECKSLVEAGYEVFLIAQAQGDSEVDGVHIIGLEKPKNRLERIFGLRGRVFELAKQIDAQIYHFHDPELIPVGLRLKKLGKRVIYDVHEDVPRQIMSKYYIPRFLRRSISKFFEVYENKSVRHFDAVVCVTSDIASRFSKLNCNTTVVQNMPMISEFSDISTDWSSKEQAVCYAGGLSVIRGIFEMVHAMQYVKGKLILAGSFVDNSSQLIATEPGWEKVQYLGHVDRGQLRQVYERAKVGLVLLHPVPNYMNSYPVKLFEYMAAGLATVTSNFPKWRAIVEENNCGICVDPTDSKQIAEAINYLLENNDVAQRMGMNGRKAVLEKFNWDNEVPRLLELYKRIAG